MSSSFVRAVALASLTALILGAPDVTPEGSDEGDECQDRDDRWSAYGTSCERMKVMCDDDFYGELVRGWCPLSCGNCAKDAKNPEADIADRAQESNLTDMGNASKDLDTIAIANSTANTNSTGIANGTNANGTNGTANGTCEGPETAKARPEAGEAETLAFTGETVVDKKSPLSGRNPDTLQVPNVSAGTGTREGNWSREARGSRGGKDSGDLSAGKAILLLEELDEVSQSPILGTTLDALGKHAMSALSSTLDALSLNLVNLTQDLGNLSDSGDRHEPKGGKGAVAQMLDFLLPDMEVEEEEPKPCPEGWERVTGDVYGGDQFSGGWRHSAETVEDCAWRCLTQPGCGSFEWSESRKRCFRNSQTRPTHEADRPGFVFCRRQPCPSFRTQEGCVGPGVSPGFYSKEVRLRPGSYCIWSGGACQAPMACTDSDCFLPDGGLPGMKLPSRYTLWISRPGLQATMQ